MGKITIFVVIGFVLAISIFVIKEYTAGTVEDAALQVSGKVIQESPIDSNIKSIFSTLFNVILPLLGFVALIGGAYTIYTKFFG